MKRAELLACVALLALGSMLVFNTQLLGSSSLWCDPRVQERLAEKDRSVKQAMQQMQEALMQQEATLSALTKERAASHELRKKLEQLSGGGGGGGGGSSSSSSSGSTRRRRRTSSVGATDEAVSAASDVAESSIAIPQALSAPEMQAGGADSTLALTGGAGSGNYKLSPEAIAVVVIAYNRPQYLDEALKSINASHPGGSSFPVYVSQDGENGPVTNVVLKYGYRSLVHPRKILSFDRGSYLSKNQGYAYLSVHYGWALRTLFGMGPSGASGAKSAAIYAGVIILEEDIRVSTDFFAYFEAAAPLLESDPTLLCVSAFNDNGQDAFPGDPRALHRSDFFPGLGWLLSRRLWDELGPKWPEARGFWDDWLRETPQRKGRASIRPEVSRTVTFGAVGTSVGQFYQKYLAKISLNVRKVDWVTEDLSYLKQQSYDALFTEWLDKATAVPNLESARKVAEQDREGANLVLRYRDEADFVSMCKQLGLMEDLKAGVPRTAYHGVVLVRINGRRLFLAPGYKVEQDITVDGHGKKAGIH